MVGELIRLPQEVQGLRDSVVDSYREDFPEEVVGSYLAGIYEHLQSALRLDTTGVITEEVVMNLYVMNLVGFLGDRAETLRKLADYSRSLRQ